MFSSILSKMLSSSGPRCYVKAIQDDISAKTVPIWLQHTVCISIIYIHITYIDVLSERGRGILHFTSPVKREYPRYSVMREDRTVFAVLHSVNMGLRDEWQHLRSNIWRRKKLIQIFIRMTVYAVLIGLHHPVSTKKGISQNLIFR